MSTSKLQQYVKQELHKYLYNYDFMENFYPQWLIDENGNRLELDFYSEKSKIAIEVQGEQHFIYSPFFHKSPEQFALQLKRDKTKKDICQKMDVHLIEICSEEQVKGAVIQILDLVCNPKTLKKVLKRNKKQEAIKNLPPQELCIYHAKEIVKNKKLVSKLESKENLTPAMSGTMRKAKNDIKAHRQKLVELYHNQESHNLAKFLIKKLFKGYLIPDLSR